MESQRSSRRTIPSRFIGPRDLLFESNSFIETRLRPAASIEVSYEPNEGLLEPATIARLEEVEALQRRSWWNRTRLRRL
jgi:hypothetical protein